MKRIVSIALMCCVLIGCLETQIRREGEIRVGLFDELRELYPDTRLDKPAGSLSVEAARGTIAGVHLLITGMNQKTAIGFQVTDSNGTPLHDARWYRMIDVYVSENTGIDRATEKFSGMINPFVIRRAPFRIYEALDPIVSPLDVDSGTTAIRLEVPIDSTLKPGKYSYKIRVDIGSMTEMFDFTVRVHRASVPPVSRSTISYINWINLDNVCKDHAVEKWSEPFWEMMQKYAGLMARGRQNTFWFLWQDFFMFDTSGTIVEFRRDRLERYIRTFLNAGFRMIHGAPIAQRRDWSSNDMLLTVNLPDGKEVPAVSEEGRRMILEMAGRIVAMMKENQWDNRWLQGVFDEPTDEFVDRYKEIVTLLRSAKPHLPILEATMTVKLSGSINVWCPQVHEYQAQREFFDRRKASGDKVWVYTCLAPGGPWLNRLCDQERLRQVYIGWACAKFDLQGFLHWGLNFHGDKPFEELVRFHAAPNTFLPAGDSHILYPGKDGPLSSQRFEAHRIGMEDYELLAQLKARDTAKALLIIDKVFQAFDRYSKNVDEYRSAKAILLESVDGLSVE
ncbi:MAG: DUF4091 domain-containing protein [Bacteroidota bacterium]|jgi:hypothetical protein